jgi:levansucrase
MIDVQYKTSRWTAAHVAHITQDKRNTIPLIGARDASPVLPGTDLWDLWPVQTVDGKTADFDGFSLWMILSAPALPDPDDRHDVARIRLMSEREGQWRDHGNLLPNSHCPGSREWAGSALFNSADNKLTLFYTAAGRRHHVGRTFEQRLFQTDGTLVNDNGCVFVRGWSEPVECFTSDDNHYVLVNQQEGKPGHIKGFRDPAHFRDPATGKDHLLFTGSLKSSVSDWNGVIGIAQSTDGEHRDWTLLAPLVSADGLNNELERPHVIVRNGLYYLFWSTQQRVFAPDGPTGPTGLYGAVAPSLFGPYAPLNGSGLVAGNPIDEPMQAYSWWVTDELESVGFIDLWGMKGSPTSNGVALRRAQFGGTPAPRFRIALEGDRTYILR